ncbi:hypothetical protein Droror1_Dr00000571 [Drosera rotundifolia]
MACDERGSRSPVLDAHNNNQECGPTEGVRLVPSEVFCHGSLTRRRCSTGQKYIGLEKIVLQVLRRDKFPVLELSVTVAKVYTPLPSSMFMLKAVETILMLICFASQIVRGI